ncbi:MAG: CBS domain-containing protein [Candidatus Heimdallarchaeota archaeon]|nr:CBS domain-containing protein [Candidatus Heimdallarchaeota archaeon]
MFPDLSEIKRRRKLLGLTQKELADIAEVSQSLITKIEKGMISPAYNLVVKIFECLENLETKVDKKAKDIMSYPIIKVSPEDTLENVTKVMQKYAFSQLPVLSSKDSCIGSISDQIILNLVSTTLEEKLDFELIADQKVKTVMGDPFPIILSKTPLKAISTLLQSVPAVLVMEGREIMGIITRADMFKIFNK